MKKLFILLMILAAVCFVGVWIYQTQRLKKNAQAKIGKGQVVMNWGLIILFVIGLVGAFAAPGDKTSAPAEHRPANEHATKVSKAQSSSESAAAASSSSSQSASSSSATSSSASSSSSSQLQVDFPTDVSLNKTGDATVSFKAPANTQFEIKDSNNNVVTTLNGNAQGADQTYNFKKPGKYHVTAHNGDQTIDKDLTVRGIGQ
jgi:cobalamin biosynthesis Mg chelatase CobN